jgi:glutamate dehydrogenase (NADP+)
MPSTWQAVQCFEQAVSAGGSQCRWRGNVRAGNEPECSTPQLDTWRSGCALHAIMQGIHQACVNHGRGDDGRVSYVRGANIAGFAKVADAMLAQG